MTTFVTYKPHYCNLRYGQAVSDKIFYLKKYGLPRNLPVVSNLLLGMLNSFRLPKDSLYFCEGPAELYPFLNGKPKGSKIIAFMKESTLYDMQDMGQQKKAFLMKLFSLADAFITDTEYYKELTEKYFDVPVFVHPPFCAQPFFNVKPDLKAKKILFIAEKDKKKGVEKLVEAFKLLRAEDPEWELFVVGRSGNLVGERLPGLHIEGFVTSLEPYMRKCSLYVHPASFDVFGVSVLESMSAGLLTIVNKGAGVSEILIEKGFRYLVTRDNKPETLARKVNEIYAYRGPKKKAISRRLQRFARVFSEEINVEQFKKIFSKAVKSIK